MTHRLEVAGGRDVLARWCNLAEQRLEYLTELFETGRWRRYHSELAFLENIQEAKAAVEIWRNLSTREASLDNSAVDMSWLGRSKAVPPRAETPGDLPHWHSPPMAIAAVLPSPPDVPVSALPGHLASDEAPSAPAMVAPTLEQGLELTLDTIEQRYPLLRNAL